MLPNYLAVYLQHIGAASVEERIVVEASDGSGLFSFKRMDHHTEVFDASESSTHSSGEAVDDY